MSSAKQIGLWTTTSLVVGNMIASGLFMLPATLGLYGGISLIGWVISGAGAMCLAMVFSWLSKLKPVATGGPYAYTHEGVGDFAAFLVAWGYWISIWCTNAAIAVAFVSYLTAFIPALGHNPMLSVGTGLGAIWFLTWVNTRGIREAGIVQVITTILKILPLVFITLGGVFFLNFDHFTPFNVSTESNLSAITSCTTLTLFAFLGLECATIPSGKVINPEVTVPKATILGTLLTTIIYVSSTLVVMGLIPPDSLHQSQAPFADAAASLWGEWARYLVAGGAVVSTFGALNGWILVQGQMPFAAARDKLFPKIFEKENKYGTPAMGLVISSLLVSVLMSMNFSKSLADTYTFIILLSTLTVLIPYLFSIIAFVMMGAKKKMLNTTKYVVAALAFVYSMWAVIGSGEEIVFWGFVLLMAGLPFYAFIKIKQDPLQ
ncbi:MAG: amino acid permease-associated protein [Bacteroidetes bacterium OLB12]|nr:MAG: amino acid permease-associated protein [Bacteroidetes bacterium OLB12]HNR72589.1 amino acid permease [Cyclobacteriaceae bacterium]HNU40990.1 amino acid permease [Cyclobacteriaceae bacterium]